MYDDDRDALAAEYVLGTLSADERDQAEALLAIDPGFAEIVRVWERRLGELNVMVEAVEPPPEVWDKIKTEVIGPEDADVLSADAARLESQAEAEEEFSFPPLEETSPQTAPELAAETLPETPPETIADETIAEEPEEAPPPAAAQSLEDLLAEPLPEMPRDVGEPSEMLASSLLPPEPETAKSADSTGAPDLLLEEDFEASLKAVVLQDLSRELGGRDSGGKDSGRGPAPEPFTPLSPPRGERSADVIVLARGVRRWRRITVAMSAIAALLAVYVAVSQFAPGLIPASRPAPPTVTAQVAPPPPSRLVAVLQQDPTTPAFLVSADPQSRMLTVRRVSAAPEPGRSYELWLISDKYPSPRSLGVVGADEFTARAIPASFDADTIKTASYAISLEPAGGSTAGVPTGPILFKGRMVESLPGSKG